jgi:hypothetical protein
MLLYTRSFLPVVPAAALARQDFRPHQNFTTVYARITRVQHDVHDRLIQLTSINPDERQL